MKAAIIMGSDSDWPLLEAAADTLAAFAIETEVVVASAHRTPELVEEFARGARGRGVEVIIAAAGAAAHLPGIVAAYTTLPVIGVPVNATPLNGMDALLSIVQMPAGVPVACMAVNGAKNAALFAAEVLAAAHPELAARLDKQRADMKGEVAEKGRRLAGIRQAKSGLPEV